MRLQAAIERFAPDFPQAAMDVLARRDLLGLPVVFNSRLRSTLGRYRSRINRHTGEEFPVDIQLNAKLRLEGPVQLRDTFLHEVAHLIAGHAAAHGYAFKRACRLVGRDTGARCAAADRPNRVIERAPLKVVAECERCGYVIKRRKRLPRTKEYTHSGGCGGRILTR
jgi:predicted SprT family Zn-dependent metalloprotease